MRLVLKIKRFQTLIIVQENKKFEIDNNTIKI